MARKLVYNIDLRDADAFRLRLSERLEKMNLKVWKDSLKQNTWNVEHPALIKQFGAIYYGGYEPKVKEIQAVAYIQLRFDLYHARSLGVEQSLKEITDYRDDTEHFIRFCFYTEHLTSLDDFCNKLERVFGK